MTATLPDAAMGTATQARGESNQAHPQPLKDEENSRQVAENQKRVNCRRGEADAEPSLCSNRACGFAR